MQIPLEESYHSPADILLLPVRWDEQLASVISDVLCPPITGLISLLMIAYATHDPTAWIWTFMAIGLVIGVPVVYIVWKIRRGEISDFHIPIRSQRVGPMLLTTGGTVLTLFLSWVGHAPALLVSMTLGGLLFAVILLLVTLLWKISGHTAIIAVLSVLFVRLLGPSFLPALLLIPLVAWARVRIRRHTVAQTIAGAVFGLIFISLMMGV